MTCCTASRRELVYHNDEIPRGAAKQDLQVAYLENSKDETVVVIENGVEKATSVIDLLKISRAKVEGITHDMPVVGRWRSADGDTFYLAIGAAISRDGNPIHTVGP